ncbi:hypothetical protein JC2156_05490 [Weissella koreensis KCTC 3621]|uniref:YfbU family protein n=1 Tax=Weissella koreensis TaxID=165096 RepID=UPI00026F3EDF|nr:YfbU family protein [Weissella koreensis]EJF33735.1 hypothetical protein JC2156_05490 [Weissella koreensis KCTC 3621]
MEFNFTDEQRVLLINQFEIMSKLAQLNGDKDESKHYSVAANGLVMGYGDWSFEDTHLQNSIDENMSETDKRFVLEVMNMYRDIYATYNELDPIDRQNVPDSKLRFIGFDGHEDTYGFYSFITRDLGRFSDVVKFIDDRGWEGDSHFDDQVLRALLDHYKLVKDSDFSDADNHKVEYLRTILNY